MDLDELRNEMLAVRDKLRQAAREAHERASSHFDNAADDLDRALMRLQWSESVYVGDSKVEQ